MDYETRARIRILPAAVLLALRLLADYTDLIPSRYGQPLFILLIAIVCIDIVWLRCDLAAK
jgi:hypothetical protein